MDCLRCEGMMVQDELIDLRESLEHMRIRAWRCVSCGNLVDPLILRHRMIQHPGVFRLHQKSHAQASAGGSKVVA